MDTKDSFDKELDDYFDIREKAYKKEDPNKLNLIKELIASNKNEESIIAEEMIRTLNEEISRHHFQGLLNYRKLVKKNGWEI